MVKVEALVLSVHNMMRLALWFLESGLYENKRLGMQILHTLTADPVPMVDFVEICLPSGAKIFKVHRSDVEMKRHGSYWIAGYDKRREENGIVPLCFDAAQYANFGKIVRIPRGF